jgi:NAD(P)-dependent dehydrogenase (short-subunit alcohol dehydrogenase family)
MTRKTILITGASRGIGRAAALLAGRRGWSVGVNYVRDEESAQKTVREIQRSGGRAVALHGDVAFEGDVIEMFEGAVRALGPLDGCVVNAGAAPAVRSSSFPRRRPGSAAPANMSITPVRKARSIR